MAGRSRPDSDAAYLDVSVTPRAAADVVGQLRDGVLAVRVTAPPADGQANRATARLIAAAIGLAPSRVMLVAGARARRKRFRIEGMTSAELRRRLGG